MENIKPLIHKSVVPNDYIRQIANINITDSMFDGILDISNFTFLMSTYVPPFAGEIKVIYTSSTPMTNDSDTCEISLSVYIGKNYTDYRFIRFIISPNLFIRNYNFESDTNVSINLSIFYLNSNSLNNFISGGSFNIATIKPNVTVSKLDKIIFVLDTKMQTLSYEK